MAVSIFYPTSASVYTRIVDSTGLTELHIDVDIAQDFIFVLTGSFPTTSSMVFIQGYDTGSTYPITASWVLTASYSINEGAVADYIGNQVFS